MKSFLKLLILLLLALLTGLLFHHFKIFARDSKSSEDLHVLITPINTPDPLVRWRKLAALQWKNDPAAVDTMLAALNDPENLLKKTAIRALGWYGDKRAIEKLIPLLADPNWDISSTAAEALGHFKDSAVAEELVKAHMNEVKISYDSLNQAIESEGAKAIEVLARVMKEGDARHREWAVERFGNIKETDTRLLPLIVSALQDVDSRVRQRAGNSLAHWNDSRATDALFSAYENEKDKDAKNSLLIELGRRQDPRILKIMIKKLRYGDTQIPEWYLNVCGHESVDALTSALRNKEMDDSGKDVIAAALLRIGDARAIPALAESLKEIHYKSNDPSAGGWGGGVYDALIGFGPRVCDALLAQSKRPKDADANAACLRILAIFKDKRAAEPLLKDLQDVYIHSESMESLRILGDKRLKPSLIALTHAKDAELRRQAWISLGRMGYKPALHKLLAYLDGDVGFKPGNPTELDALGELRENGAVPALLKILQSDDYDTWWRADACEALANIGDPRAIAPLRKMQNIDWDGVGHMYNPAAYAIEEIFKKSSVSTIARYLKDADGKLCKEALEALKSNGSKAALALLSESLAERLKYGNAEERFSICEMLYDIHSPVIEKALRKLLNDPETKIRLHAIHTLFHEYGARDIAPAVIPLLSQEMEDRDNKYLLDQVLIKCKDPRTTKPLLKLLNNSNDTAQAHAAIGLGALKEKRDVPQLIEFAEPKPGILPAKFKRHYPSYDLQEAALWALGEIGDARALPVLLALLRSDPPGDCNEPPNFGAVAALALGKCRDKRAIEPLILSLQDPLVSGAAAEALGMIGDRRAIEPLKKLLTDTPSSATILGALAKLGDRDALDQLFVIAKKNDRYYNRDAAAVHALGAINDARVVPALIAALARNPACDAAAQELAIRKEPRAIPALIAALRKDGYNYSLVEALRDITRQSFGGNPDKWSAWWKAQAARQGK